MKHALFSKEIVVKKQASDPFGFSSLFGPRKAPDGEQWKEDAKEEEKPEEVFVFVGFVDSPKDVAALVRKAPLKKYVLFRGEFAEVKIAMPVFVDGKSLDTMAEEWG